jgi:hypothetical protein
MVAEPLGVDNREVVSIVQQLYRQHRANEPATAGKQNIHGIF